jgi:hypothetical protein
LNGDYESSRDVVVWPAMVMSYAMAMNDYFGDGNDDAFRVVVCVGFVLDRKWNELQ